MVGKDTVVQTKPFHKPELNYNRVLVAEPQLKAPSSHDDEVYLLSQSSF